MRSVHPLAIAPAIKVLLELEYADRLAHRRFDV